jgi:hypothetical protein
MDKPNLLPLPPAIIKAGTLKPLFEVNAFGLFVGFAVIVVMPLALEVIRFLIS